MKSPKQSPSLISRLRATKQQETDNASHIVVKAYAGTGKTFTCIVGVAWAFGQSKWGEITSGIAKMANKPTEGYQVVPSPEQQAVWDSFKLSTNVRSVVYCAFNKSIVTEFGEKWGWLVKILQDIGVNLQFSTVNALGNKVLYNSYGRLNITDNATDNLLAKVLCKDVFELKRENPVFLNGVKELVGLCKLTLSEPTHEVLEDLAEFYAVDVNGSKERIFSTVPEILRAAQEIGTDWRECDFNDQNYLPIVNNLHIPKVDLLLVDEGQDLPRCKQEFCIRSGHRVVLVGDTFQAIYGFAGADVDSIPRLRNILSQTSRGVVTLKLTETRRCGKAIVKEAQRFVPDFKAHDSNSEGKVATVPISKWAELAQDGDMALCRVNAPLISHALRFIKAGRKAIIRGRDFGTQLIKFVEKLKAKDVPDLIERATKWVIMETDKENKKRNPSDAKLQAIQDKYSCIEAISEGLDTVAKVTEAIDLVFAGKQCPNCKKHFNETNDRCPICKTEEVSGASWRQGPLLVVPNGVIFSSVHRAKGLEAKTVFILMPKGAEMPHPMAKMAWEKEQERNCLYIAITRAINELIYVK